jgi:hypothetical protein
LAGFAKNDNRYKNVPGTVCDQKTSKFFVSHQEECMAGHKGINEVYEKLGKKKIQRKAW